METIKVNMTPCEDVQTIHASQNDGEARQWGFELHNNGDVIDSSEITDQITFKAYKGGTEQLLPENGSTPTTSPFLGDIKYPQGLLSDQEFLYRESPTEEDGLAKVNSIKGNTLVWNQLVQNGNFADSSNWFTRDGATLTVSNNVGTLVTTSASISAIITRFSYAQGHKYLIKLSAKSSSGQILGVGLTNNGGTLGKPKMNISATSTWQEYSVVDIATTAPSASAGDNGLVIRNNNATAQTVELKNVQIFDLTQMGLDITDPSEFTSLFPLPYYDYNVGSLLSFNGNGLKTVGFNLFDQDSVLTSVGFTKQSDGSFYIQYPSTAQYKVLFENKLKYSGQFFLVYKYKYANTTSQGCRFEIHYTDGSVDQLYADGSTDFLTKTFITRANKVLDYISATYGSNIETWWKDVCINISDPSKNGTYEPYTETTTNLPISTYFPSGMKSAGNVYDELTESKAITRIGAVELGSLNWHYLASGSDVAPYFWVSFTDIKSVGNPSLFEANIMCSKYRTVKRSPEYFVNGTICADGTNTTLTQIQIKDSSYTDATALKSSLQGVYLYYEMVNETETSFTTASLVTENAEIPLSNEDGVLIGKCTEQLSAEPGFHDAKIKLSDSDGTCYSNKIQLHVERSPQ